MATVIASQIEEGMELDLTEQAEKWEDCCGECQTAVRRAYGEAGEPFLVARVEIARDGRVAVEDEGFRTLFYFEPSDEVALA